MTSSQSSACDLSDRDLLAQLHRAVESERHATARLIALLNEVDTRKLYAAQGCSSLFTYCVQMLHLSEHAAYLRIEAARLARRFPAILERLASGSIHLTAVSLIGPHLTPTNHVELLDAVTHKSKRDIEHMIASVRPQQDVPTVVRKLPVQTCRASIDPMLPSTAAPGDEQAPIEASPFAVAAPVARPAEIKPVAPHRYKVQFTVTAETHEKLRRVQDLMRHIVPHGDPALIFDRALTVLLAELSRTKFADTKRTQHSRATGARSRHIPAHVKREVWARDGGQCAFLGDGRRCGETGFVEFHHVIPFADGGEASAANIELRCRTHNQYEAERWSDTTPRPDAREGHASYGG